MYVAYPLDLYVVHKWIAMATKLTKRAFYKDKKPMAQILKNQFVP
ncbi:hypothetical protein SAMN05877753_104274 [Bacillus oleivorans]|uniref:Uncharacterized protein n=1 Tax=Bacillus oleivorans TaxID=1448271 RepID=A0A285CUI4_9BACI|nr:hypothetical protein SAMN05877753_104274 [Bacillus oleivorans]